MDYGFQRFGRLRHGGRATDQQRLVATAAAAQAASPTARAMLAASGARAGFADDRAALVELYAAGPDAPAAAAALGHGFRSGFAAGMTNRP